MKTSDGAHPYSTIFARMRAARNSCTHMHCVQLHTSRLVTPSLPLDTMAAAATGKGLVCTVDVSDDGGTDGFS